MTTSGNYPDPERARQEVETGLTRLAAFRAQLRARGWSEARVEQETSALMFQRSGVPGAIMRLREIHPTGPILDEWELVT